MGRMGMLMKILTCNWSNIVADSTTTPAPDTQHQHQNQEHVSNHEPIEKVTYEMAMSWQESFDNLMSTKQGQKIFADFLKGEYSDENILFWQAVEELKREKNPEKIEEKARIIYEDFVSILSPKEVSIDSKIRESVNLSMKQPTTTTFNEAQSQIYTLMHRDSYARFLACPAYVNLIRSGVVEEL